MIFMATFKPMERLSPAPRTEFEILVAMGPFCTTEETETGPCSVLLGQGEKRESGEDAYLSRLHLEKRSTSDDHVYCDCVAGGKQ